MACAGRLVLARTEHVDLEKRRMFVSGTKTDQAAAEVPLSASAIPWFQAALAQRSQKQATLFAPWGNIRRDLELACDRAEIDPVSPNDLRRTFSSWLEQAGIPRGTNARLMRHTTTAMVDRVYARSAPEALVTAVDHLPQTHVSPVPPPKVTVDVETPDTSSRGSAV